MMTGSCTESQAKYIEFLMKDYDDDKFDDMIAAHYTIGFSWRAGNTRRQKLRKISKQAASDIISELKSDVK